MFQIPEYLMLVVLVGGKGDTNTGTFFLLFGFVLGILFYALV
jgi:hypothetical protein